MMVWRCKATGVRGSREKRRWMMRNEDKPMIRMKVKGVYGTDSRDFIVVLQDYGNTRYLPIVIGMMEAQSIYMALENITPPRPLTHDLLRNVIENMNGKVMKISIDELKEDIYYAKISLETPFGGIEVDSRPSDAIALALRTDASIWVAEELTREIPEIPEGEGGD